MNLQEILTFYIELRKHEFFSTSIISEREHPFLLKLLAYTKDCEAYIWAKFQVEILSFNIFYKYVKLVITPKGSHMGTLILLGFSGLTKSYSWAKCHFKSFSPLREISWKV
jgi:REP element-mobilizing transposase RayT